MRRLRRLRQLSLARRRLLPRALAAVVAARIGLSILPYETVQRLATRLARPVATGGGGADASDITWAVAAVGRRLPWATCLVQALAARILLARAGYPTRIQLGVGRDDAGAFTAHAWVEDDRGILLGAPAPGRFAPLPMPADGSCPLPRLRVAPGPPPPARWGAGPGGDGAAR